MANPSGWLVIDKPLGMTSREVVNRAMGWFPRRTAVGHTGTLDPLATGVLVLAVGVATRLAEYVQAMSKTYLAEFTLGATSATDDSEGPITPVDNAAEPDRGRVEQELSKFIGVIQQVPPHYSAIQVAGQRAYRQARAGKKTELAARPVRIDGIQLIDYEYPSLRVEVRCGKGTYIRSLARDLGAALGCGGYVSQLRRTAIGDFTTAEAVTLESETPNVLSLDRGVSGLTRLDIPENLIKPLSHGNELRLVHDLPIDAEVAAFANGNLVAIARTAPNSVRPIKVLAPQM